MSLQVGIFRRERNLAILVVAFFLGAGVFAIGSGLAGRGCSVAAQKADQSIPILGVKILKIYPHDPHAFTQGLEYFDGFLY